MKYALVYDDLFQNGGGENLFLQIVQLYPNADIYVPIVKKEFRKKINTNLYYSSYLTFLARTGKVGYYLASLISWFWFESLKFQKYDCVISVSNRWAHLIITPEKTKHIAIVTSPFRQLWEDKNKSVVSILLAFLRVLNFYSGKRPDVIIPISNYVKNKIEKTWGTSEFQTIKVIYPPFINRFTKTKKRNTTIKNFKLKPKSYFLIVGRINKWKYKHFEEALESFAKNGKIIVVVGTGEYEKYLKNKFTNKNIVFLGSVSNSELGILYKNCKALVHPQIEDFGLTPLESLYFNRPVIAHNKGGVCEYLNSSVAMLYNTFDELENFIKISDEFVFDRKVASKILQLHSTDNFKYNLYSCSR